jgi:hypothetical protein
LDGGNDNASSISRNLDYESLIKLKGSYPFNRKQIVEPELEIDKNNLIKLG